MIIVQSSFRNKDFIKTRYSVFKGREQFINPEESFHSLAMSDYITYLKYYSTRFVCVLEGKEDEILSLKRD